MKQDTGDQSVLRQTNVAVMNLTICPDQLSERQICAGQLKTETFDVHDACAVLENNCSKIYNCKPLTSRPSFFIHVLH